MVVLPSFLGIYPLHPLGTLSMSFTKSETASILTLLGLTSISPSVDCPFVTRPLTVPRGCAEILVAVPNDNKLLVWDTSVMEFLTKEGENYKPEFKGRPKISHTG